MVRTLFVLMCNTISRIRIIITKVVLYFILGGRNSKQLQRQNILRQLIWEIQYNAHSLLPFFLSIRFLSPLC